MHQGMSNMYPFAYYYLYNTKIEKHYKYMIYRICIYVPQNT